MRGSGFSPFSMNTRRLAYLGNWKADFLAMAASNGEENLDIRLFMDARDWSASNLRDKIYSLQGISSKALAACITVDYKKTVESVYVDYTKHLLKICPILRVLSAVHLRHRTVSTLQLPSWVPDWSLPRCGDGILNRYYRFAPARMFRAAGASKPRVTVVGNSDTICLEGILLDTVECVIPIKSLLLTSGDNSFSVTETTLREMTADVSSCETYPFTGERSWKAFFRTLTAGHTALSPRLQEYYRANKFPASYNWNLDGDDEGLSLQDLPAEA